MDGNECILGGRNETPLTPLLLGQLPQQIEIRAPEDDWTGLADSGERRKLQNRLNQRAWRRRKANKRRKDKLKTVRKNGDANEAMPGLKNCTGTITDRQSLETDSSAESQVLEGASSPILISGPVARQYMTTCHPGLAEIQDLMSRFEESASRDYALGSPRIDHLLTLIQFNVFRALLTNTKALGFTTEWLNEDAMSPFTTNPGRLDSISCPPSLLPTRLQRTIPHHPWLDLFPIPTMRDNILRAGDSFDDTHLCMDLVEFWSSPGERSGLVVWGDPWDPRSWEVSEEFLTKWAWIVRGCWDLFRSTNSWRLKRGERRLFSDASLSELALL